LAPCTFNYINVKVLYKLSVDFSFWIMNEMAKKVDYIARRGGEERCIQSFGGET